jgi:acetolactate synthase-1/2/3 large subunit
MGDGALSYNPALAALGFAQEYNTPVLVVLFNNQGYASMKSGLLRFYPQGWAVKTRTFHGSEIIPTPDYPAVARAFGWHGERVEEPAELGPAVQRGLAAVQSGTPALVDVVVEREDLRRR